jgi:hypothetical protein
MDTKENPEEERLLERSRHRWEGSIRKNLKDI